MEIVYRQKKEDNEALYDYMVKETQQGRTINKQAFQRELLNCFIGPALVGLFFKATGEEWKNVVGVVILFFVGMVAFFFLRAGLKPRYSYGKQVYEEQEKYRTPKDIQVSLLPRRLIVDDTWLEVSNSEALHRWRWRQVDQIGITKDFIFVYIAAYHVLFIPKRDFPSEQNFIEFGKTLLDLKEKYKDQPIGGE